MIITTTGDIEGRTINAYLGIVAGEAIVGANIVRDLFASVGDVVGGRSGSYEKVLASARVAALETIEAEALDLGANAIVGLSLDYEVVGDKGSMLMVVAAGTAVTLAD
jgi:uncharacterized protein YbjQ (UPF0145 family)